MQISARFTTAIHVLLCTAHFSNLRRVTSDFLGESVGSNPVIIRRLLGQLQRAGLVVVRGGPGGTRVAKPLTDITLLDVFNAVQATEDSMFRFHDNPDYKCPIGKNIHKLLDKRLEAVRDALNRELAAMNMGQLYEECLPFICGVQAGGGQDMPS